MNVVFGCLWMDRYAVIKNGPETYLLLVRTDAICCSQIA